jgi:hypothetical protein
VGSPGADYFSVRFCFSFLGRERPWKWVVGRWTGGARRSEAAMRRLCSPFAIFSYLLSARLARFG